MTSSLQFLQLVLQAWSLAKSQGWVGLELMITNGNWMLRYGSKNFETWNCFLAVLACILHELHVLSVSKDYEPYEANKQHGCIFSSMVRLSPFSAFTQLASYHSICSRSPIHSVPSKWHRVFSWHVLVASGKEATWFSGILFIDEVVLSALKSFSSNHLQPIFRLNLPVPGQQTQRPPLFRAGPAGNWGISAATVILIKSIPWSLGNANPIPGSFWMMKSWQFQVESYVDAYALWRWLKSKCWWFSSCNPTSTLILVVKFPIFEWLNLVFVK